MKEMGGRILLCPLYILLAGFLPHQILGVNHAILYPKIFRVDTEENVVVNLHGYGSTGVNIHAELRCTGVPQVKVKRVSNVNANTPIQFEISVPGDWFENAYQLETKMATLRIQVSFAGGRYPNIVKTAEIAVSGKSDNIFVMTDRPIYKPGEDVKIRAAALNPHMLLSGDYDRAQFSIETESGIGIWRKDLTRHNGFFTEKYQTTELTPPGVYFAVARILRQGHIATGKAKFVIDRYVLPSFDVKMEIDKHTVAPMGEITGSFRARYSHGNDVVGKFTYKATLHVPGNGSIVLYQYPSDPMRYLPGLMRGRYAGKGNIRVRTRFAPTKSGKTWDELIEARATISITVSVKGDANGVVRSHRVEGILITNTPYLIDVSDSSKYFVPGLQHHLNIVIRDVVTGDAVQGVAVTVVRTDDDEPRPYRTDARGRVHGVVQTNIPDRHIRVNISMEWLTLPLDLRSQDINQGFLRILANDSFMTVGQTLNVEFRSQASNVPNKIHYMILCRGSIVQFSTITTSGRPVNNVPLGITRKMSPKIRIVGYYVRGDHFISDSTTVAVEEVCISEELTIGLTAIQDRVDINLEGQPNAYFATRAVDKAALFLNDEGHIDPDDLFQKMKQSDMGCTYGGGIDAMTVFKDAGLGAVTKLVSTPTDRSLNCSADGNERRKRSVTFNIDQNLIEREFLRRCYLDGKKENIGGLSCEYRTALLQNTLDEDQFRMCSPEFRRGCELGEHFRRTLAFRNQHSRTRTVRFDADSTLTTVTSTKDVRDNFVEGWLWLQDQLDGNGYGDVHSRMPPDSITIHQIDAISVHETQGACIAQPAELRVFKKVFVKLFLPFSIKLMEEAQLRAAIFNYGDAPVTVHLRIKTDKFVCSRASQGQYHDQGLVKIQNGSSASFQFIVIPIEVPPKNRKSRIWAEVVQSPGSRIDAVQRNLNIEDPGQLQEFSQSYSLDPAVVGQTHTMELNFPDDNILPGSRSCEIYGYMTYLGPLIEFDPIEETPRNLEGAVRVPSGCGEQNMKSVGPNVFIYKFLKSEEQEIAKENIEKYIAAGYTREIGHMNNRRWSIWHSWAPTIWLNAYVNKVFLHARDVWEELDMQYICDSLRWVVTQQTPSGSFSELHHSHHYWINIAEGGDISLTAYVLISVSEQIIDCGDDALHQSISGMKLKAIRYLQDSLESVPNHYTSAVVSYALSLSNPGSNEAIKAKRSLLGQRMETADEIYWISSTDVNRNIKTWHKRNQKPINIEATAYALLALVRFARAQGTSVDRSSVDLINKVARWMVNQQNDRGGFVTSQTTVVAIQSMVEYAIWIAELEPYMEDPNLSLDLTSDGDSSWNGGYHFVLDDNNRLHRKNITIPNDVLKNSRRIIASNIEGIGRGQLSYRCTFRTTKDPEPVCDYNINVQTELNDKEFTLKLNISKKSPGKSGMAIVDISFMTGYKPIEDTLKAIKKDRVLDGVIDEYEISKTNVILYVEKIESEGELPLVLGFRMSKDTDVTNPNPAQIRVYDYYHPDESQCTAFYSEPNYSPSILKYCRSPGSAPSDRPLCKCMDGGCPICRSWGDSVNSTCVRGCRRQRGAMDLVLTTCDRNYAFIITIQKLDSESMPLFIKMESTIVENLYHRDIGEIEETGQQRTFIINKGCFDSVKNAKGGSYFSEGNSYLIMGKAHDSRLISSGQKRIDYLMDKDTIVSKAVLFQKCKQLKKKSKKSVKAKDRVTVCGYQKELQKQLGEKACEK